MIKRNISICKQSIQMSLYKEYIQNVFERDKKQSFNVYLKYTLETSFWLMKILTYNRDDLKDLISISISIGTPCTYYLVKNNKFNRFLGNQFVELNGYHTMHVTCVYTVHCIQTLWFMYIIIYNYLQSSNIFHSFIWVSLKDQS